MYYDLPVVGHSVLYYYNKDAGKWYVTQVGGDWWQIGLGIAESTTVLGLSLFNIPVISPFNIALTGISVGKITNEDVEPENLWNRMSEKSNNYEYVPLYGDYTSVYKAVGSYPRYTFYSLYFQNCATYIVDLLKKSEHQDLYDAVKNQFIPSELLRSIKAFNG